MRAVRLRKLNRRPCLGSTEDHINAKEWDTRFLKPRREYTDRLFLPPRQQHDTRSSELEHLLYAGFGGQIPSGVINKIKLFCQELSTFSVGGRDIQARGKVYDIEIPSGLRRQHPEWLSAGEMRSVLIEPRIGVDFEANADIRLIYIYHLDRDYIQSLVSTGNFNEAHALQETIWKHIARETSMQVHIPLSGYFTFRLEFHLSYFILKAVSETGETSETPITVDAQDSWHDLALLSISPEEKGNSVYCIKEAHVSFVVAGSDNTNWRGYLFAETGMADSTFEEEEEEDEDDENVRPEEDYLASGNNGEVLLTEHIIQDPRVYWLRVVGLRLAITVKEWDDIVHHVEETIHAWEARHRLALSGGLNDANQKQIRALSDWVQGVERLLIKLWDLISKTIIAWKRFSASDGDMCYFRDISGSKARLMNNVIKKLFERLAVLRNQLHICIKLIEATSSRLERYLQLESTHMCFENNKYSRETIMVSRDMHELSRQSTETSSANLQAAIETTLITNKNLQLLWITTPFVLVLQYFGSDRDIFSFERNAKTFIVCVLLLWLALPILTHILNFANQIKDAALNKCKKRMGKHAPSMTEGIV